MHCGRDMLRSLGVDPPRNLGTPACQRPYPLSAREEEEKETTKKAADALHEMACRAKNWRDERAEACQVPEAISSEQVAECFLCRKCVRIEETRRLPAARRRRRVLRPFSSPHTIRQRYGRGGIRHLPLSSSSLSVTQSILIPRGCAG